MRKRDMDLMRQLRREEEKARLANNTKALAEEAAENTVRFDLWWVDVAKQLNLQPYMKEIVWADFKARGLKKEAPAAKYAEALALFGYKLPV